MLTSVSTLCESVQDKIRAHPQWPTILYHVDVVHPHLASDDPRQIVVSYGFCASRCEELERILRGECALGVAARRLAAILGRDDALPLEEVHHAAEQLLTVHLRAMSVLGTFLHDVGLGTLIVEFNQ